MLYDWRLGKIPGFSFGRDDVGMEDVLMAGTFVDAGPAKSFQGSP